jgi:uncharacterized protein YrzB (UPF0473 family)
MEDKRLFIQDEQGNEIEYEIVLTFTHPDTSISYVVYRDLDDEEDVYVARYTETSPQEGTLLDVETDEEYDMIQEVLDAFFQDEE